MATQTQLTRRPRKPARPSLAPLAYAQGTPDPKTDDLLARIDAVLAANTPRSTP